MRARSKLRMAASLLVVAVAVGVAVRLTGNLWWRRLGWTKHAWKTPRPAPCAGGAGVPRRVHQTWKTADVTSKQKRLMDSWKAHYPEGTGWEHTLWTDDMIETYVRDRWSWYLPVWQQLTPYIKNVDTVRYMWMYDIGGIYADIDMKCLAPLDLAEEEPGAAYIPVGLRGVDWEYDQDEASPAFLASAPGNPVWLHVLRYVALNTRRPVLKATGPVALANVLLSLRDAEGLHITLLSETAMGIGRFKALGRYAHHQNHGKWTEARPPEGEPAWTPQPRVLAHLDGLLRQHEKKNAACV